LDDGIVHLDKKNLALCRAGARVLRDRRISPLIVNGAAAPAGIITVRDYVNLVADGQDPAAVTVAERMTTDLVIVEASADVADAAHLMAERHIRHLPVVDHGKLIGVISIRDPVVRHPAFRLRPRGLVRPVDWPGL
jgi:CBS domain-containing protein